MALRPLHTGPPIAFPSLFGPWLIFFTLFSFYLPYLQTFSSIQTHQTLRKVNNHADETRAHL